MSPYKPQHTVACAHCREQTDADLDCPGCQRAVCSRCAARPESCRRPRARVSRLGRGARLRGVDPDGQIAAVSTWTGKLRLWDLSARRYVHDLVGSRWTGDSPLWGGLGRDGLLVEYRDRFFLDLVSLCNCGGHAVLVTGERLEIPGVGGVFRPLPRSVINRAAFDCATGLLVVASHDQLVAFRETEGSIERIGSARIEGEPVCFVAAAGDRVISLTRAGRRGRLRAYRCASTVFYPLPFYEWIGGERPELRFRPVDAPPADPADPVGDEVGVARDQFIEVEPERAAVSSDGRLAAIALADSVTAVHLLDRGRVRLYGDHTDGLCHVALPAGGRLLVTGDYDNRVIVRERDGDSFARWLVD